MAFKRISDTLEGMSKDGKVASEKETRKVLFNYAKFFGCEHDLKQKFDYYEMLMRNCRDKNEYKAIAVAGVQDILSFMQMKEEMVINGKLLN